MELDYVRVFKWFVFDLGFLCVFLNFVLFFFINSVVIYIRLLNLFNVKRNDELKSIILLLKGYLLNVLFWNVIIVLECVVCYKFKLEIFGFKLKIVMVLFYVI